MVALLQALVDRHAMLRLRVDDGTEGWSLSASEPGSVDAGACLRTVDVLSDEAFAKARSRLNPAAGAMLSALWVDTTGQLALVVHHLAVDGVSWRILLEDLNIRLGSASQWAADRAAVGWDVVCSMVGTAGRARPGSRRRGPRPGLARGGGGPVGVARGATWAGYLRHGGAFVG